MEEMRGKMWAAVFSVNCAFSVMHRTALRPMTYPRQRGNYGFW